MTTVRSVARRPLPPMSLPSMSKLTHVTADLCEPAARRALEGVDVLWHLAFQLWRSGTSSELGPVNLDGTRNVLAARPGRVVFASSASVYGAWPDNPVPLTEAHTPRPNREVTYAAQKLEVERRCLDAAPSAVLRLSAVLGPHADARVRRAAQGYRLAVPAVRGVRQALQFLDEDDAAVALHRAGKSTATGVFNIATDDWLDEDGIARLSGGRVVRLPLKAMLTGSEVAARLRLLPFGADRSVLLNGPLALAPTLAATSFAWRPSHRSDEVLTRFLCS